MKHITYWIGISILGQAKAVARANGNIRLLGMQAVSSSVKQLYLDF